MINSSSSYTCRLCEKKVSNLLWCLAVVSLAKNLSKKVASSYYIVVAR